jgi:hypothetical protein
MSNQPGSQTPTGNPATTTSVPVKKKLSKWATIGLDLSDPGFSKLHSKESHFPDDSIAKYDLEADKFESFKQSLIEKVNRIHGKMVMAVDDDGGNRCDLLREYTKITEDNMENAKNLRWPKTDPTFQDQRAMDIFTDTQLKASVIGNYINEALTDNAKQQLRASQEYFEVEDDDGNPYFDGPSYFWKIADLVDPDNGHLIENVRRKLRTLNVKDFGFSIIKMLAEFKNLKRRIGELGGTYDTDDQFLDFWDAVKTMKERKFARYVETEKDNFRKLARNKRGVVEHYIRDFTSKEVAMTTDNEWNIMSPEDAMVMALVNIIDSKDSKDSKASKDTKGSKNENKDSKGNRNQNKSSDELTPEERQKRYDDRIPDWKKVPPKDDEPQSMIKDGKEYFYCKKCRNGKGMWALHKTEQHTSNYQQSRTKKVAFQADTSESPPSSDDKETTTTKSSASKPSISVKKELLTNAKAYLAQFSDFQEGGMQG